MLLGFLIQLLSLFFLYLNRANHDRTGFWLDMSFICLAAVGVGIIWAS